MSERAEVAYRETQYGIRLPSGEIHSAAIGPNEAERYRAAGVDIHVRHRTVYVEDVTEWREVASPVVGSDAEREARPHAARLAAQRPTPAPTEES